MGMKIGDRRMKNGDKWKKIRQGDEEWRQVEE
jgi:hypothetical protein